MAKTVGWGGEPLRESREKAVLAVNGKLKSEDKIVQWGGTK